MGENESKGSGPITDPEIWLKDYGDYLFRYALVRLRSRESAEDTVQETFLAALKGKEKFRGEASEKTWLVGILKHKIIDHFRKNKDEFAMTDILLPDGSEEDFFDQKGKWKVAPAAWADDPKEILEKKEFWRAIERCILELPSRLAKVFSLREFEGLETEKICNLLKISATNLGVILFRARTQLVRCLETKWFAKKKEG
jgi:RNA polymerase sigma-70 factor (ECF subfamily)